jgi:hypothetical protein
METLFRFHLVRPALLPDPRYPPLRLAQQSRFQADLAAGAAESDARAGMQRVANAFISNADFVALDRENPQNIHLDDAAEFLDQLSKSVVKEDDSELSRDKLLQGLEKALKKNPLEIGAEEAELLRRLKDSVVAVQQVHVESPGYTKVSSHRIRVLDFLKRMKDDVNFPIDHSDLRNWWLRPILAPTLAELKSILSNAKQREEAIKKFQENLKGKYALATANFTKYTALKNALKEIRVAAPKFLLTTPPRTLREAFNPPKAFTRDYLKGRHLQLLNTIADLSKVHYQTILGTRSGEVLQARAQAEGDEQPFVRGPTLQDLPSANVLAPLVEFNKLILAESKSIRPSRPLGAAEAIDSKPLRFTLSPEASGSLSQSTHEALKDLAITFHEDPLPQIVRQIENEIATNAIALDDLYSKYDQPPEVSISKVGGMMVRSKTVDSGRWRGAAIDLANKPPRFINMIDPELLFPSKVGHIRIAGIADLLVVKQQLVGYEGADVAHIENMLKGEKKTREVTARQEIESITTTEEERTVSEEKESSTTSRFETSNESEQTIKEEEALKAGVTTSVSYGPTFSLTANIEGSKSRSMEESQKAATKKASEITEKAAQKIQTRVLQKSSLRITTETTDKATHSWTNEGGSENINGVYQYVNKVYEAQTWTYGKRTMLEFMVPEPGAFLFDGPAEKKDENKAAGLPEVPPFTKQSQELDAEEARKWIYLYGVTDTLPYPSEVDIASKGLAALVTEEEQSATQKEDLEVKPGYEFSAVTLVFAGLPNEGYLVNATVGAEAFPMRLDGNGMFHETRKMSGGAGKIPVTCTSWDVQSWSLSATAICSPTPQARTTWQIDTWQKIEARRQKLVAERDAKVAAINAEAAAQAYNETIVNPGFVGDNPALNLQTMRDEMKKSCISIMTDQHFDFFNAITDESGVSEVNFDKANVEGPYVRFFEQAFEWDQMTWLTYPYFWGRKKNWFRKIAYEDPDPIFRDFMRAGYARANVPIRLGFEGAVDHFFSTGEAWQGQGMPAIQSDLFLPISVEIEESLGKKAGMEEKYGDSWFVKIPTNLVTLRTDDKLPVWLKQKDGGWKSADDPSAREGAVTPQPSWG